VYNPFVHLLRGRRTLAAGLCLAIVVVAACLPGMSALDWIVFELPWVLLPDQSVAGAAGTPCQPGERSRPLFQLLPPRAPPAFAA
jgi:hypothetical protein